MGIYWGVVLGTAAPVDVREREGSRTLQGEALLCVAVLIKALGNSNFGMSLQSYSELRRGGWTFIPLGEGM